MINEQFCYKVKYQQIDQDNQIVKQKLRIFIQMFGKYNNLQGFANEKNINFRMTFSNFQTRNNQQRSIIGKEKYNIKRIKTLRETKS